MTTASLKKGMVLSVIAVQLLLSGCASSERDLYYANLVKCKGINGCRGLGECKGPFNSCKAKNACKGQGWLSQPPQMCVKEQLVNVKDQLVNH